MQIYCKVSITEYRIADWHRKQVKIYMFDWKNTVWNTKKMFYLMKIIIN